MKRFTFGFILLLGIGMLGMPTPALAHDHCGEDDKMVAAAAIQTRDDIRAFVTCAHRYVMDNGFEEAYRAFHEEERWKSGSIYVFVDQLTMDGNEATSYVFPPNKAREGDPWGPLLDDWGNDYFQDTYRLISMAPDGSMGFWTYYSFTDPATEAAAPKSSYIMGLEWNGMPALIGAGIYERDLPSACSANDVNAMTVGSEMNPRRLQEFVRCAAMRVEKDGYFAKADLMTDSRWREGSVYLFGMDRNGTQFFTGNPVRVNGIGMQEWGDAQDPMGPFGGRDVINVAKAFGETFLYYNAFNPATGRSQRKVSFVKRVMAQGSEVLIGSGYYLPDEMMGQ